VAAASRRLARNFLTDAPDGGSSERREPWREPQREPWCEHRIALIEKSSTEIRSESTSALLAGSFAATTLITRLEEHHYVRVLCTLVCTESTHRYTRARIIGARSVRWRCRRVEGRLHFRRHPPSCSSPGAVTLHCVGKILTLDISPRLPGRPEKTVGSAVLFT